MAETTDELLARMAKKYGLPDAPQAQPAPKQQIPAEPPKRGIIDTLRGRGQQIDQAVDQATKGYAKGGKICAMAHGGKIHGPGTPTSDSIHAKVEQTGEQIKVSTGERILSAEQDAYLASMAQQMGYDSLDAMLEAGTGKPVGPTVKDGQRAAASGASPDDWMRTFNPETDDPDNVARGYRQANAELGKALTTDRKVSVTPASESGPWRNPNIGSITAALTDNGKFFNFGSAAPNVKNPGVASPQSNPLISAVIPGGMSRASSTIGAQTPGAPTATPQPAANPQPAIPAITQGIGLTGALPPGITRGVENGLASYSGKGDGSGDGGRSPMDIYTNAGRIQDQMIAQPTRGGIIRNTQADDQRAFDNFTARSTLESGLQDAVRRGSARGIAAAAGPLAQFADQIPAQDLRRDALEQQGDIQRQGLDQQARYQGAQIGVQQQEQTNKGLLAGLAQREADDKAQTNALTRDVSKFELGQKQQLAGLQKEYLDPATTLARRSEIAGYLRTMNGKDTEDKVLIAPTATTDAQGVTTKGYDVVNARTGQKVSNSGGQAPTIPQSAIDALKSNPDKAAEFDSKYGPGASSNYLQKR